MVNALDSMVLIQVQQDFAVRFGSESMAAGFELGTLALEIIEFSIHNGMNAAIFVSQRLVAGAQVDDAQSSVAQHYCSGGGLPVPACVRPAVVEDLGSPADGVAIRATVVIYRSNDSAHRLTVYRTVRETRSLSPAVRVLVEE